MTGTEILARIGQAIIVLWASFTLAFLLLTALPGDAIATRYADPELGLSPEEIAQMREIYGADESLATRYLHSLTGALKGDFGNSLATGESVSSALRSALPNTLALALTAFVLASLIAIILAVLAAPGRSNRFSTTLAGWISGVPSLLVALPAFWLGIILIQIFSFQLAWIPVIDASPTQSLILPAIAIALPLSAPMAQVLIRGIEDASAQPFVTVVRARGASPSWVLWRNVLRNAMLPALTIAGLTFGELIGGAVVTEAVFSRAGIGAMTVEAVSNRDTPVLMAVVVLSALVYVLVNLAVDLAYPLLDPRLRSTTAKKTRRHQPGQELNHA